MNERIKGVRRGSTSMRVAANDHTPASQRPARLRVLPPPVLALLRHTADGAFAVDSRQKIVAWNEAAEWILGWNEQEVLGRPCCDVIRGPGEQRRPICDEGCRAFRLAGGQAPAPAHDLVLLGKGGIETCVNMSTALLPNGIHTLTLVHFFRDITEQRQALLLAKHIIAEASKHADPTGGNGRPSSPGASAELTRREQEVLRHLASGASTALTAKLLFVSIHTVRNHIKGLLRKLNAHSRLEAISRAYPGGSKVVAPAGDVDGRLR